MESETITVILKPGAQSGLPEYLITVLVTVISGVLVFLFCEYLKEIWLAPLQKYKKIREKVSFVLTMYSCYYINPIDIAETDNKLPDSYKKASEELRMSAAELCAFIETLSWFKPGIPKKEKIFSASANLIGLSNGMCTPYRTKDEYTFDHNLKHANEIRSNLNIYGGKKQ